MTLKSYAAFRSWVVSQIVDGATPRQVSRMLGNYKLRHLTNADAAWSDGLPELPTDKEIDSLGRDEW